MAAIGDEWADVWADNIWDDVWFGSGTGGAPSMAILIGIIGDITPAMEFSPDESPYNYDQE